MVLIGYFPLSLRSVEVTDFLFSMVNLLKEEQNILRFLLSRSSSTRMDLLRDIVQLTYPSTVTVLLVQNLRGRSSFQYENT